jgi:hypothetical protein
MSQETVPQPTLALLLFSDPPGLLNHMPLSLAAGIWVVSLLCHLAGIFVLLALVGHLQRQRRVGTVWLPAVSLLALVPTVSATEMLVFAIAGPDYPVIVLRKVIFYFCIVQIMEFAFIRFLLIPQEPAQAPRETLPKARTGTPAAAPAQAPEPLLDLGDRRLPLRHLRYLSAQEHYVEIVLDVDKLLKRARLGDLVAQTDAADGIQPHRSWWVSRNTAPRLERRSGRHVIVTDCGLEVPVARGRVETVTRWFERHGPFEPSPEPVTAPDLPRGGLAEKG